jgi:hypothetical protein
LICCRKNFPFRRFGTVSRLRVLKNDRGAGIFVLSLWTTARMRCRFKPKLLGDVDHPVFARTVMGFSENFYTQNTRRASRTTVTDRRAGLRHGTQYRLMDEVDAAFDRRSYRNRASRGIYRRPIILP